MQRRIRFFGAVLVTGSLLLASCSDDGSESSQPGEDAAPPEAQVTDDADEATDEGAGESRAGVEERDAETIVEQTVVLPGSADDQATVGIQSLTVEDEIMVLRLVVTPDFASVSDDTVVTLGQALDAGGFMFGVNLRLLDRANLKEYSVINTNVQYWASQALKVGSRNGEAMYAFAVFAAPEDDIDTVDVRIHEQWPEFTDVPITR